MVTGQKKTCSRWWGMGLEVILIDFDQKKNAKKIFDFFDFFDIFLFWLGLKRGLEGLVKPVLVDLEENFGPTANLKGFAAPQNGHRGEILPSKLSSLVVFH